MARGRRGHTEVSCVIKFLLFGSNFIFWLAGCAVLGVGIYASVDKNTIGKIEMVASDILFDPALIFIIVGGIMFIIGFFGCVGALRENTTLLLIYIISLSIILAAFLGFAIYAFVEQEGAKELVKGALLPMIVKYRDDPDLQDIIDWAQESWLKCCGIENYNDWDMNIYFNCTSPSVERCGVPSSCCRINLDEALKNTQCGFGVRSEQIESEIVDKIYDQGCFDAMVDWFMGNLIPIAAAIVIVVLVMILGICFAQNLRSDIQAQKAKWGRSH